MNLRKLIKHIILLILLTSLLILGITYPFLSGDYDRLAVPISTMIQVFGLVGLTLVPVGVLWLFMPKHKFGLAIAALIVGTFVILIISLFATLSVGKSFGVLTLLIAIENANQFIRHIEEYYAQHRQYPLTLQAQNKDYFPDVVGVEKYLYAPHRKSYNLTFEQPRFLLDRFGTREWVVYNPLDENSVYSHTAWLLPTEQVEPSQGWYASGNTGHPHWKYFLFD